MGWGLGCTSIPLFAQNPSLRELSADRPDSTESPYTVPAGRWQLESSFFSLTTDKTGDTDIEAWAVGETNLKYGWSPRSDIQLVLSPWLSIREETPAGLSESEGFGDMELRLKWNLWGNDQGATAAGLLPYLKIPAGADEVSHEEWEGGLIVPFAWQVQRRFSVGLQSEIARNFDPGAGFYWAFSYTAVLGFDITTDIGAYLEYAATISKLPYESLASGGVTYQANDNLQFDLGALVGLNNPSPDLTVFSGVTVRF